MRGEMERFGVFKRSRDGVFGLSQCVDWSLSTCNWPISVRDNPNEKTWRDKWGIGAWFIPISNERDTGFVVCHVGMHPFEKGKR